MTNQLFDKIIEEQLWFTNAIKRVRSRKTVTRKCLPFVDADGKVVREVTWYVKDDEDVK